MSADRTERPLTRAGRTVRVGAALAMVLALMATSVWGEDDFFPFAPFKMYSRAHDTDGWADSTNVFLENAEGERIAISDNDTGFRRAELEGQLTRFREDPDLLAYIAEAYEAAHPDEPEIVAAEIITKRYELVDGARTGEETEEVVAAWTEEGTA
ncbi:hypothetical protein [Glycomyces artemisiae]|uniref:Uncharacterized protein n=1 Tax=Glycomyces artemisiae TaxID=1076443 RepID=A0A2T0UKJ4_9ACTN|nr:hypothetical protein [Glycomyces artemisiae]PRY58453.1 hypothetical protein B0I28_105166 [Glycomyces artemisiae]